MIQRDATVKAASEDEVVACRLAGEAALLSLRHDAYYGLDAVGAVIWELIQPGRTVAEVHAALLARYDVDPERCERDLLALLGDMAQAGLISVQPPPAATPATP